MNTFSIKYIPLESLYLISLSKNFIKIISQWNKSNFLLFTSIHAESVKVFEGMDNNSKKTCSNKYNLQNIHMTEKEVMFYAKGKNILFFVGKRFLSRK